MTKELKDWELAAEIVCQSEDGGYLFTSFGCETFTEEQVQRAISFYERHNIIDY